MRLIPLMWLVACTASKEPVVDDTDLDTDVPDTDVPDTDITPAVDSPNILIVIVDDFGLDLASFDSSSPCYDVGDTSNDPPMPHLASLCTEGVRFDNAWAAATCSPTRASMLTGTLPYQHGVGGPWSQNDSLDTSSWTLPKALADANAGYATANIGKWHLTANADDVLDAGWDHFAGFLGGNVSDYMNWTRYENGTQSEVTEYATTAHVDDAISWLDDVSDTPWLLWLAFGAPHSPDHAPPDDLHTQGELGEPGSGPGSDNLPFTVAASEALDTELGRLFEWLEAHDEWDDTIVIALGDNGTSNGVAESPFSRATSKGTLYQGGVAVPFVIAGPGVAAGSSTALVTVADVFPTVLELAGVDVAAVTPASVTLDGVSLADCLTGGSCGNDAAVTEMASEMTNNMFSNGKAIRDDAWKLICWEDGTTALFDLSSDPWEGDDLYPGGATGADDAYTSLSTRLESWTGVDICP